MTLEIPTKPNRIWSATTDVLSPGLVIFVAFEVWPN
jgi:hypothetical protein